MKAREIYEKQTGDICPTHQIEYSEWQIRYRNWLEEQIQLYVGINDIDTSETLPAYELRAENGRHHLYIIKGNVRLPFIGDTEILQTVDMCSENPKCEAKFTVWAKIADSTTVNYIIKIGE